MSRKAQLDAGVLRRVNAALSPTLGSAPAGEGGCRTNPAVCPRGTRVRDGAATRSPRFRCETGAEHGRRLLSRWTTEQPHGPSSSTVTSAAPGPIECSRTVPCRPTGQRFGRPRGCPFGRDSVNACRCTRTAQSAGVGRVPPHCARSRSPLAGLPRPHARCLHADGNVLVP
jgi:hypothetical protein